MLEAFMPVAVYSVISSILFDLDSGLASGMFVLNTLFFLFLVLPFIMLASGTFFAF
jgi:predicted permease